MNQKHIRLASSISALLMLPALAGAQANDPSAGSSGSNSSQEQAPATSGGSRGTTSGSSGTSDSVNDTDSDTSTGSSATGSSATGSSATGSSATGSSASGDTSASGPRPATGSTAQQPIDRSEVQHVFGMDAQLIDLKSLDQEQIRSLQQALQQKGHKVGEIDGVMGPQTRSALMAALANQYALTQRLISQGQITNQLANSLGLNDMVNVSGVDSDPSLQNQGSMQNQQGVSPSSPSDPADSPSEERMTPPPVAPSPGDSPSGTSPIYPSSPEPNDPER